MDKARKDNKGRNLRPGETQRSDGSYMYVYKFGTKKKYIYATDLAELRKKPAKLSMIRMMASAHRTRPALL